MRVLRAIGLWEPAQRTTVSRTVLISGSRNEHSPQPRKSYELIIDRVLSGVSGDVNSFCLISPHIGQ